MLRTIITSCVTLGPIGYWYAPGTMASLFTLTLAYIFNFGVLAWYVQMTIVVILAALALLMVDHVLPQFVQADPPQIVLDELVGQLAACIGIGASLPELAVPFVLFRFFDITKWAGVAFFERLPGAWGVVMDDIFAGILATVITHLILYGFYTYHL